MTMWNESFSAELYARLLLDQNQEEDVFDVWVGNEDECVKLAGVFEQRFKCTVYRDKAGSLTVCCPDVTFGND